LVAIIRLLQVASEREHTTASWHLEKQVDIMWHRHELGERRPPQYSVIGRFEVGHLELDELGSVVLPRLKSDWENDCSKRMRGIARDNTVKRSFTQSELVVKVQTHLLQRTGEDKIESAPTIDKNPSKLDLCDHGIQH
jgi:hypothetical protein